MIIPSTFFFLPENPEMAYLQAVTSAGVTFTVTRACGSGEIVECGCDNRIDTELQEEEGTEWEWGGCSDDIRFGMYFSRDFVDASEEGDNAASMMTLHNYEAGRRVRESLFHFFGTDISGGKGVGRKSK